jgi:hypothetical protein
MLVLVKHPEEQLVEIVLLGIQEGVLSNILVSRRWVDFLIELVGLPVRCALTGVGYLDVCSLMVVLMT